MRDLRPRPQSQDLDHVEAARQHFGDQYAFLLRMKKSNDLDSLIERLQGFVEQKGGGTVTTHQLRNIYDRAKKLKPGQLQDLKMLRPMFAYIGARNKDMRKLTDVLDDLVKSAKTDEELAGFQEFMQAIVAYQKFFEKKNQKEDLP